MPASQAQTAAPPPNRRRFLRALVLVLAAPPVALTLALAIGSLVSPGASPPITVIAALSWGIIGPLLVLLCLLACAAAILVAVHQRTRPAMVISALAAVALIWSGAIVASIVTATARAGGTTNPLTVLIPSGPSPAPDATETYIAGAQPQDALIYAPTDPSNAPVMYFIHGGGWVIGSAAEVGPQLRTYADQGWLVIAVDYALATPTSPTWDIAPAQVACGLTWAANNASRFGGDPSKITVVGESAGGNLAVNLGWASANAQATSACPGAGPVPVPSAVVASYPVVNPQDAYDNGASFLTPPSTKSFTKDYLGGTPEQHPDRMRAISSATYLSAQVPPTLIVEPERDDFIPAQGVYDVVQQAQDAGADVTLAKIPFTHHSFNAVPGTLGAQSQASIAEHFLAQRSLAPTPCC